MSTHLTNKEIDNFVSGAAGRCAERKALKHIAVCPECRALINTLSSVTAVQQYEQSPGDHVIENIKAEWFRIHESAAAQNYRIKPRISIFIKGLAVAASIVAGISVYLVTATNFITDDYPLSVTAVHGKVILNDSLLADGDRLSNGDLIVTENNSYFSASFPGYEIHTGRSSSLEIVLNSIKNGIGFRLHRGFVISKSSLPVKYGFQCGEYKINPAGTEFMLGFSDNKLLVAVSQGGVIVTGTNLKVEIPAGMKWSSERPGSLDTLDDETVVLLNSLPQGIWPSNKFYDNNSIKDSGVINSTNTGGNKTEIDSENNDEENLSQDKSENKLERKKINRELRDEMNNLKKEQRQEKRIRNRG